MIEMKEWQKPLWLAKRTSDENAEIQTFAEPIKFMINYQPMSGNTDMLAYGENISQYQKAVVPKFRYLNEFKEGDRVYIDGTEYVGGEEWVGEKANYTVDSVRNQHLAITLIFKKIINE